MEAIHTGVELKVFISMDMPHPKSADHHPHGQDTLSGVVVWQLRRRVWQEVSSNFTVGLSERGLASGLFVQHIEYTSKCIFRMIIALFAFGSLLRERSRVSSERGLYGC